jgi:hypothetical protein
MTGLIHLLFMVFGQQLAASVWEVAGCVGCERAQPETQWGEGLFSPNLK